MGVLGLGNGAMHFFNPQAAFRAIQRTLLKCYSTGSWETANV